MRDLINKEADNSKENLLHSNKEGRAVSSHYFMLNMFIVLYMTSGEINPLVWFMLQVKTMYKIKVQRCLRIKSWFFILKM